MASLDDFEPLPSGPASQGPKRKSIWSAIHPKLLELVRSHRSTLIFVNSRRLAERISGAINELAGEDLVRAHHGSVAVAQRKEIEDRLKLGTLRGIVATSSLELGIDMRRTTGRSNAQERLWVYRRKNDACRRCGEPIQSRKQGKDARTTFWCPICQPLHPIQTSKS